jgi:hypothetical protein
MVMFSAPDMPLNPGDSWTLTAEDLIPEETLAEVKAEMGLEELPYTLDLTHTLRERVAGEVTIDLAMAAGLDEEAIAKLMPKNEMMPNMEMKIEASGTGTGSIILDETMGWVRKRETSVQVKGNQRMLGVMGEGSSMEMPFDINIRATVEMFES